MRKHILRRSLGLMALLLALLLALPASAAQVDPARRGSLRLTMRDSATKEPISGGKVVLYRVAAVREDLSGYVWTEEFAACGQTLDDISSPALAEALGAFVREKGLKGTESAFDAGGVARFSDLSVGLYLMVQSEAAPGYGSFAPFAVSIPMQGADGEYIYDVDATPKPGDLSPLPTPTPAPSPKPTPTPGTKIPQTGQLWWPVVALASAGCLCLLAGWMAGRKRSKRER